jgi:pyridine nucleotide-disulfide oxidoreductase family protein
VAKVNRLVHPGRVRRGGAWTAMTGRVILAGGGHAHLAVLADWARAPWPGTVRTLITAQRHTAYSGMLPGWMAGIYRKDELLIDLAPLAEQAGAELVLAEVVGLDPERQILQLSTGAEAAFDLLSLATGGESDVTALSALGERLLPVRPVGEFMARWQRFLESQSANSTPVVAVVGGGAGGVELALAACAAAQVMLIAGPYGVLPDYAPRVRALANKALAQRGVTVHAALATGHPDGLALPDGTILPADLVIAATGSVAPRWLGQSGLGCTEQGFVAVGADLRSLSHPAIFAAGDIIERTDRPLPRSGVHAVKAGPVLAANLRAALAGAPLQTYQPSARTLYLLSQGDHRAIASWGALATSGRLTWWLKDQIDRRFIARYTR